MEYVNIDIEALWGVLIRMPFDEGGFYVRSLLAMYRNMHALPADDRAACIMLGGVDIRTYRRFKAALLMREKCFVEKPSGRISNLRFEEEISQYITEFRNRQTAAFEREKERKNAVHDKPRSEALSGDLSEKPNEINGGGTTIVVSGQKEGLLGDLSRKLNEINEGRAQLWSGQVDVSKHDLNNVLLEKHNKINEGGAELCFCPKNGQNGVLSGDLSEKRNEINGGRAELWFEPPKTGLLGDLSEKPNKINGTPTTTVVSQSEKSLRGAFESNGIELVGSEVSEVSEVKYNTHARAHETPEPAKPAKRRTRLPEGWRLPRDWGIWTLEAFFVTPDEIRAEAERFKDFWLSTGEQKLDWQRTWQVWCRSPKRRWRRRPNAASDASDPILPLVAPDGKSEYLAELQRAREILGGGDGD